METAQWISTNKVSAAHVLRKHHKPF